MKHLQFSSLSIIKIFHDFFFSIIILKFILNIFFNKIQYKNKLLSHFYELSVPNVLYYSMVIIITNYNNYAHSKLIENSLRTYELINYLL